MIDLIISFRRHLPGGYPVIGRKAKFCSTTVKEFNMMKTRFICVAMTMIVSLSLCVQSVSGFEAPLRLKDQIEDNPWFEEMVAMPDGVKLYTYGSMPPPDFRDDVVSFVLPPITERLDVRGRITADLTVESDCEDTCFYIRVSVDKGDGKWYLLRDDINSLSTAAREGRLVKSGNRATISYRFPDHAFRLEPGDRLRVDVASACSQFAPHTNIAGDQFAIREPKTAHNKVIAAASRLILPCTER